MGGGGGKGRGVTMTTDMDIDMDIDILGATTRNHNDDLLLLVQYVRFRAIANV